MCYVRTCTTLEVSVSVFAPVRARVSERLTTCPKLGHVSEITALSCLISDTLKRPPKGYRVEIKVPHGCHPIDPEPQLLQSQQIFHMQSCVQATAKKQQNLSEIRAFDCTSNPSTNCWMLDSTGSRKSLSPSISPPPRPSRLHPDWPHLISADDG